MPAFKSKLLFVCIGLFVCASSAFAGDPAFTYDKKGKTDGVEWKVEALAGLVATTGNAETTTFSGGANASRKESANKMRL